jgi:hypothetical protein
MSALLDVKKQSYALQRAASHGAGITLVSGCGAFSASFDCAKHIASVLGNRELKDAGDGIFEVIPTYAIPTAELHAALTKISNRFSIALVECVVTERGSQFVLLWKIPAAEKRPLTMEDF